MNPLHAELDRLYGNAPRGRAAVVSVSLPAGWMALAEAWRGVQADLELPAPAIAVSGRDALQLWFSFAAPVSSSTAARFLQGLRERYLRDVDASRVGLFAAATDLPPDPCGEVSPQQWSAFVTHDLASLFAETPWLDLPPGDDGQAAMLRGLRPIDLRALAVALDRLGVGSDAMAVDAATPAARPHVDPARFLAAVMNDGTAPLALRIEAARILLRDARKS